MEAEHGALQASSLSPAPLVCQCLCVCVCVCWGGGLLHDEHQCFDTSHIMHQVTSSSGRRGMLGDGWVGGGAGEGGMVELNQSQCLMTALIIVVIRRVSEHQPTRQRRARVQLLLFVSHSVITECGLRSLESGPFVSGFDLMDINP